MERASQVGKWIPILPRAQNHTFLEEKELGDNAMLQYQYRPNNVTDKCDGFASNKSFTLQHVLQYKLVWLVAGRHNKVHNYLAILGTHAFSSYYIHD